MTDEYVPPYDPAALAAIRSARADLYAAQAHRRAIYLRTGKWAPQLDAPPAVPRQGDPVDDPPPAVMVDIRRANLDEARAAARVSGVTRGRHADV